MSEQRRLRIADWGLRIEPQAVATRPGGRGFAHEPAERGQLVRANPSSAMNARTSCPRSAGVVAPQSICAARKSKSFFSFLNPQSAIRNPQSAAFTLLEIMLVVAILAVALAFGIPAISDAVHRAPIAQATKDIMDACRHARSQAILNGQPMELRIYPRELRVEVAQAPVDVAPGSTPPPPSSGASEPAAAPTAHYQPQSPFISSAKISEDVRFEMVDVNFIEYKDADVARVRFYPNGTCDELTLVMHSDMEYRKISLEVVTSLASVDADVNGFNAR